MRLNINLATRPYQDIGRFLRRWLTATAIFIVASCALAFWAFHTWQASSGVNRQISELHDQIAKFDRERTEAARVLNEPGNKSVADTSHFLNQLIARKSFSWTRVFMQMEQILPGRLHVLSMTPELTPNNELQLNMRVGGDSREKAIELVRRLEESPSFRQPQLRSEIMSKQTGSGPMQSDPVLFDITTLYVPNAAPEAAQHPAQTAANTPAKGAHR